MTSAGLVISNAFGLTQITEDYKCIKLLKCFTLEQYCENNLLAQAREDEVYMFVSVDYKTEPDRTGVYAEVRRKEVYIGLCPYDNPEASETFYDCTRENVKDFGVGGVIIHVWGTTKLAKHKSTYGLQVFDASGNLVFDSADKALTIKDFYFGSHKEFKNLGERYKISKNETFIVIQPPLMHFRTCKFFTRVPRSYMYEDLSVPRVYIDSEGYLQSGVFPYGSGGLGSFYSMSGHVWGLYAEDYLGVLIIDTKGVRIEQEL